MILQSHADLTKFKNYTKESCYLVFSFLGMTTFHISHQKSSTIYVLHFLEKSLQSVIGQYSSQCSNTYLNSNLYQRLLQQDYFRL